MAAGLVLPIRGLFVWLHVAPRGVCRKTQLPVLPRGGVRTWRLGGSASRWRSLWGLPRRRRCGRGRCARGGLRHGRRRGRGRGRRRGDELRHRRRRRRRRCGGHDDGRCRCRCRCDELWHRCGLCQRNSHVGCGCGFAHGGLCGRDGVGEQQLGASSSSFGDAGQERPGHPRTMSSPNGPTRDLGPQGRLGEVADSNRPPTSGQMLGAGWLARVKPSAARAASAPRRVRSTSATGSRR